MSVQDYLDLKRSNKGAAFRPGDKAAMWRDCTKFAEAHAKLPLFSQKMKFVSSDHFSSLETISEGERLLETQQTESTAGIETETLLNKSPAISDTRIGSRFARPWGPKHATPPPH